MPYGTLIPDGTITAAKLAAGVIPAASELAVGTVLDWVGTFDATHKPDAGEWKECDGAAIAQATYADLYTLFGASRWGADAGGNFILPNFKRRVTLGRDPCTAPACLNGVQLCRMDGVNSGSGFGGCESKVLLTSEIPSHQHSYGYCGVGFGSTQAVCAANGTFSANCGSASWQTGNSGTCGSGNGHLLLPPYAVVYKIIKVKKAA
jgi:microcystin-dependent protein